MGYQQYPDEIRQLALDALQANGGAMQNHQLAKIALAEGWPIHHEGMWGTHGILNTLREDGLIIKVRRGRYALYDSPEALSAEPTIQKERAKARIKQTTHSTVSQSGKATKRFFKDKELRCKSFEATLERLWERQNGRCAQTLVPFDEENPELRASLDRIDSDGHYADGTFAGDQNNLQLVTHWYNMTKGIRTDAETRSLLKLHAANLL